MISSKKPLRQGYPWKCNYCGGSLMFYSILDFSDPLRKQLAKQINVPETAIFRVEKCENKKCGRTYIFIDPLLPASVLKTYLRRRTKYVKAVNDSLDTKGEETK